MMVYVPEDVVENVEPLRKYLYFFATDSNYDETPQYKLASLDSPSPKNEVHIKDIVNAANEPMLVCKENGHIIMVNPRVTDLFGFSESEIIGKELKLLFKSDLDVKKKGTEMIQAIKKNAETFPAKISISSAHGMIVATIQDASQEEQYKQVVQEQKETNEKLLSTMFPAPVADRIIQGEHNIAESFPDVTCFKSELVGFRGISSEMSALDLVQLLNACVSALDDLCDQHGLIKIKSSGDDYLCVGGVHSHERDHAQIVIQFANDAIQEIHDVSPQLTLRVGIHTGPITAGVIGKNRQTYDVWGNTVETTVLICKTGLSGRIQCSRETFDRVHELYRFEERQVDQIKVYVITEDEVERPPSIISNYSNANTEDDWTRPITQPPSPSSFIRATTPLSRPITPTMMNTLIQPSPARKGSSLPPIEKPPQKKPE
jgi:PAS domain S-box-containing protein